MRISAVLLVLAIPSSAYAQPLGSLQQRILDNHNRERAAVGSAPLRWNVQLERDATEHARLLARTGHLVHAPREGRGNVRENLSRVPMGWGPDQTMQNWLNERQHFHGGTYPSVCTGGWSACAHYTQVIWPDTTDVGCGMAAGRGFNWFVCRYSPGGNKDGKRLGVAAYGSPPGMGPTDSAKSRQRLGTPGQSHRQSNLNVLCNPRRLVSSDGATRMREARERRKALEEEVKRIQAAIKAAQAGLADYDPSLIEELLGTADAPPTEQLAALSKRLEELREQMRAEQERQKKLMEELQKRQARIEGNEGLCRDHDNISRAYDEPGRSDREVRQNTRDD